MSDDFVWEENPEGMRLLREDIAENSMPIIDEALDAIKNECPVVTGKLRDSFKNAGMNPETLEGAIVTDCEYAATVVLGNRSRHPNDFVDRALKEVSV